jgi:RNA polymerase sigma-70 factor (ECF subfamily)
MPRQDPYALGRAAYPHLAVSPGRFADRLAAWSAQQTNGSASEPLIPDLYLACACSDRVAGAATTFQTAYGDGIRRAVARVLSNPIEREDAQQRTLDALLVGEGKPKLDQYLGQGPLGHWVAVVAIRTAVSMGRAQTAEVRLRQKAVAEAASVISPELLLIKQELRAELETAVGEALRRLPDRERLALRLYLVSGMPLAAIAKSFGVSGPTVSRWLARARETIVRDVHRALGERLKVDKSDLKSFARLVMSELNVSISRLLGAA